MHKVRIVRAALVVAASATLSIGVAQLHQSIDDTDVTSGILRDPSADNTDVYAFTAPDAPGSVAGPV